MSYVNTGAISGIISSGAGSTSWTTPNNTFSTPVTITKGASITVQDEFGETTDVGKAAKMFMWWMQTYHPELEEQFNAVEDTKR